MSQTRHASTARLDLRQALDEPAADRPVPDSWRWVVRQHLAGVRDQLAHEGAHPQDAGLAARDGALLRERDCLLRPTALSSARAGGTTATSCSKRRPGSSRASTGR